MTRRADRLRRPRARRARSAPRSPSARPAPSRAASPRSRSASRAAASSIIRRTSIRSCSSIPRRCRAARARSREEAAVRIGQRVVELLQARDGEGYVLRVDLRLRPSPEVDADRAAGRRARSPITNRRRCRGSARRSSARARRRATSRWASVSSTRSARSSGGARSISARSARSASISRRIRDHHAQGQAFGPGYDLKRGRGGIREVEFFAQIHQLIHGGRDPALRAPATRDALAGWPRRGGSARTRRRR